MVVQVVRVNMVWPCLLWVSVIVFECIVQCSSICFIFTAYIWSSTDGPSDTVSLPAQDSLRHPGTAYPQLAHPKGKSQLSAAPKTRQTKLTDTSQEQKTAVSLKGSHNNNPSTVPRRPKSILKTPKRHLPTHTQAALVPDVTRSTLDAPKMQQKKTAPSSPNADSKEKQHRTMPPHKVLLDAPPLSMFTVTAGMSSHYQSTPVHTATSNCLNQPTHAIQPNFSLSSIEGSDPAHRMTAAQKTTTPHSQKRRRSGIPTSTSTVSYSVLYTHICMCAHTRVLVRSCNLWYHMSPIMLASTRTKQQQGPHQPRSPTGPDSQTLACPPSSPRHHQCRRHSTNLRPSQG